MILVARAFFDVKTNQINLSNYDYLEPDQGVKKKGNANHGFSRCFYEFEGERARFMALKANQINSSKCQVKGSHARAFYVA